MTPTAPAQSLQPDGARESPGVADSSLLKIDAATTPPYPGLRAFSRDENAIFFGRDASLDAMVDQLAETNFLSVLGPSGSGKSSLVRAGLYTSLHLGLHPQAGGRWRIAEFRPGRDPVRNLAAALIDASSDEDWTVELLVAHLRRGPRAILELINGGLIGESWNLLIVADQFEELFRFGDYAGREETEAVIALLLESASSDLPVQVVITMRSEYIGACSLVPQLAEQISRGMYLTPRMTRSQCQEAIEGPAAVRSFSLGPDLVAQILNDLQCFAPFDGGDGMGQVEQLALQADQLPLMQHVLNRMWQRATDARAQDEQDGIALTLADYDGAGGLTGALDAHGEVVLGELEARFGPEILVIAERVFRALAGGSNPSLAVRRPRPIVELATAAGGGDVRDKVEAVIDAFRGPDCNFLRTSDPDLKDKTIVDLGHESLIRRWSRYRSWFEKEIEAKIAWRRLSEDALLASSGEGGLLNDRNLRRATDWWSHHQPTPYIADRYGGNFDSVRYFLSDSQNAQMRKARKERRLRFYLRGSILAAVILAVITAFLLLNQKLSKIEQQEAQYKARVNATVMYQALRNYIGNQYCRGHRDTPIYEVCVGERVVIAMRGLQDRLSEIPEGNSGELSH